MQNLKKKIIKKKQRKAIETSELPLVTHIHPQILIIAYYLNESSFYECQEIHNWCCPLYSENVSLKIPSRNYSLSSHNIINIST